MKEKDETKTTRRNLLKNSGLVILGGLVGQGILSKKAAAEIEAEAATTGIHHAMWTMGYSGEIEYPDRVQSFVRKGWGLEITAKPSTVNWIHFAIPTPVIVDARRLRADKVILLYKTGSADAWLSDVHVWDGLYRRKTEVVTTWPRGVLAYRTVDLPNPFVYYGIGISVCIKCGVEMMSHNFSFYAAGCDFIL